MSSKKLLLGLVFSLVLLGGLYFFLSQDNVTDTENTSQSVSDYSVRNEVSPSKEDLAVEREFSVVDLAMNSEASKSIELTDVTAAATGTGTAYISRTEQGLNHFVNVQLPQLEDSEFYEGWLVKDPAQNEFFSTGAMQFRGEGNYVLEFQSPELFEGYDTVVITLETIADDTPEAHVLEGTFVY